MNSNAGPCGVPSWGFKGTSKQLVIVAVPSQVPASNVLVTSFVNLLSRTVDTILVMWIGEEWWLVGALVTFP